MATFVVNLALPCAIMVAYAGLPGAARQLLSAAAHAASAGGSGRALSAVPGSLSSLQHWLMAEIAARGNPAALARQQQQAWGHCLAVRGIASSSCRSAEAGKNGKDCCIWRCELLGHVTPVQAPQSGNTNWLPG